MSRSYKAGKELAHPIPPWTAWAPGAEDAMECGAEAWRKQVGIREESSYTTTGLPAPPSHPVCRMPGIQALTLRRLPEDSLLETLSCPLEKISLCWMFSWSFRSILYSTLLCSVFQEANHNTLCHVGSLSCWLLGRFCWGKGALAWAWKIGRERWLEYLFSPFMTC